MEKVLAIAELKADDRLAYWHDVAAKRIVKHECEIRRDTDFDATILHAPLGDLEVLTLESRGLKFAQVNERTIADDPNDNFLVCLGVTGITRMSQGGREAVLSRGDFTLIDTRRPFECRYSESWKHVILRIPHQALNAQIGATETLTAHTISAAEGVGSLVSAYIQMMPEHIIGLKPGAKLQLAEHLLDLTALALAGNTDRNGAATSSTRSLALMRVRMAIESRLSDPRLDPVAVASAAGVSVRYANGLLSEQGTSLERLIVSRRLERCRRALEDPTQRQRTISEIAFAWGFSNLSHFVRRFKAAYHSSPGEYRRSLYD